MNKLEKLAFYVILAVSFLLPVIFVTPAALPLDILKASVFSIGTTTALFLILISNVRSGKISFLKGKSIYAILLVLLSFILSALSVAKQVGFYKTVIGAGSETSTVLFALVAVAFVYTVTVVVNSKEKFVTLLSTVVLGGILLSLFHLVRFIFGADTLTFGGMFSSQITNTVGQWNDLGVYFGFMLLISYFGVEFMTLSKFIRGMLYVLGALSIVFLMVIGFSSVWYGIAFVVFLSGLYLKKHSKISYRTIGLFVLALILSVYGQTVAGKVSTKFGINQLDVRPSWELSVDMANSALQQNPIFGVGPNRYLNVYLLNKPQSVNETVFWSLDFTSGVSYITSFVVTLGVVGLVAILWLIILIGVYAYKLYRHTASDSVQRFSIVSGVGLTIYSVVLGIFYNPSISIVVLGLTSFALFLVVLKEEGMLARKSFEGSTQRKTLIVKIIATALSVIVLIGFIYFVRRAIAANYFSRAVVALNSKNDIDTAEKLVSKAASIVDRELYYQGVSEVSVLKINRLLSTLKEADQASVDTLKSYLEVGILNAQNAIKLDSLNYQNYITQARVYESVIPVRVTGAYENAMKSYASASSLNPLNPSIYLLAARLEVAMKKLPEAKQFIGRSLQAKNNYSDAIFLLSQIQVSENSIKDAITSLLVLAQLNPQDPTIFFQLGLLYYNQGDNVNTGLALSKAIDLSPEYSNARYFLGLALARLGKYKEAQVQFEEILKFNPDNPEITNILTSLKAGRSPFQQQAVVTPEKSKTPPVKDAIDKKTSTKVKTR